MTLKKILAGRLKRITFDPAAVERNLPRVRRREPVFKIEAEEGDTFVTYLAYSIRIEGVTETTYNPATGFIRFTTKDVVVFDDIGAASDARAPEPPSSPPNATEQPKKGKR